MSDQNPIYQLFASFSEINALVIGDLMLDHYVYGSVSRISPEAPMPLLDVEKHVYSLGGAGNVASNMYYMGANVRLISVIGDDIGGHRLLDQLKVHEMDSSGIQLSNERKTTEKNRIFSQNRQIFRYDEEMQHDLSPQLEIALLNKIEESINELKPSVIVLQDYNKGVLTVNVIQQIIEMANERGIPTAADPKKKNFFAYEGCTLFKPNLREAVEGLTMPIQADNKDSLDSAAELISHHLKNKTTVITLAEKGIYIKHGKDSEINPAIQKEVYDVCGAGDSVMAMLAIGLCKPEVDLFNFVDFANLAASQVCQKAGVATIDLNELFNEINARIQG